MEIVVASPVFKLAFQLQQLCAASASFQNMFFRAALVLLVIAVFLVSENQIVTVFVALGVGAYFCLGYTSTGTPPSPSPSPVPDGAHITKLQQDIKTLQGTNATLQSENQKLKHESDLLTKDIRNNSDKMTRLARVEQEYETFKKLTAAEKAQASKDPADRTRELRLANQDVRQLNETLTQQIQDLKQQIATLTQQNAASTNQIKKLQAKMVPSTPPPAVAGGGVPVPTTAAPPGVILAKYPHIPFTGHSIAPDGLKKKATHVDIMIPVNPSSWRGSRVDKSCPAFNLASHFISRFQGVCTNSSEAKQHALFGSDDDLRGVMTDARSQSLIAKFGNNPFPAALECLVEECTRILQFEPMLVPVHGDAKVFGDIHGQLVDLFALFREHGFPSNRRGGDVESVSYIFDGDFVDRGPQQVEVMLLLLSLKVAFPGRVVLLRGNHEFRDMNESPRNHLCFAQACKVYPSFGPHGPVAFELFQLVFQWLPFAALVADTVLVLHGGIGDGKWAESVGQTDIDWLRSNNCRPLESLYDSNPRISLRQQKTLMNIVWSDPETDPKPPEYQPHYKNGTRGADILTFSSELTQLFCERNRVSMILRGHEVAEQGYELLHGGRVCTVFSARNYCVTRKNDSAIVFLQPDRNGHVQVKFKTLEHLP